jgi:hypothetical protein
MVKSEREVYEHEAYGYYQDGIKALGIGDTSEAEWCFVMAEGYLKDAGINYTGKGESLRWSA